MFRFISATAVVFLLVSTAFAQPGPGRGRGQCLRLRDQQCPFAAGPAAPATTTRPADSQADSMRPAPQQTGQACWRQVRRGANAGRCQLCPAGCGRGRCRMGEGAGGQGTGFGRRGGEWHGGR